MKLGDTTNFKLKQQLKIPVEEHLDDYPSVEPLLEFDWKETKPIKIRPFKPKYNLTMS